MKKPYIWKACREHGHLIVNPDHPGRGLCLRCKKKFCEVPHTRWDYDVSLPTVYLNTEEAPTAWCRYCDEHLVGHELMIFLLFYDPQSWDDD